MKKLKEAEPSLVVIHISKAYLMLCKNENKSEARGTACTLKNMAPI